MRIVQLAAAVVAGVAVVPLGGALQPPQPAFAASSRAVTATPGHGISGAPFTVEYREPVALLFGPCSADSVTVTYDGATLGTAPLRQQSGDCVATLSTTSRGRPGRHEIRIAGTSVATVYTVDPPPSPTAGAPDHSSPSPTRPAGSAGSATPSATPSAVAASTRYPPTPTAGRYATPSEPAITMPGPYALGGGSATSWLLTVGGILILGDLCLLAVLAVRTRRPARSP